MEYIEKEKKTVSSLSVSSLSYKQAVEIKKMMSNKIHLVQTRNMTHYPSF